MEGGSIKAINSTSVHRICSGQVVLSLATAVKELVENSIDAEASIIEVKLKEHGSEVIEVTDNGKGVKSSDFQSLTLKHHTSKIGDFSDVQFVTTFGFRGEALSSLCALSNLEIITRHIESDVGTALTFDHNSILTKSVSTHRQTGTTVILRNIFSTFPVRHKEFIRHIRKEYMRMVQLLTAYCLISVNKCITCSNVNEKGKRTVVLSTSGHPTYKDNILSIFGAKQMKQLIEIVQHIPSEEILEEFLLSESAAEVSKTYELEGYISKSTHGEGRSSLDRQFYFINGRPCDLPKVAKVINEVYHAFNKAQYPFVFLNILLKEGCADVNVTPNKREIFIPDEKVLLALIKMTILTMYGKQALPLMSGSLQLQTDKTVQKSILTHLKGNSVSSVSQTLTDASLKRKLSTEDLSKKKGHILPPSSMIVKPGGFRDKALLLDVTSATKDSHSSRLESQVTKTEVFPQSLMKISQIQTQSEKQKCMSFSLSALSNKDTVPKRASSSEKLCRLKLKEVLNTSKFPTSQTSNSPLSLPLKVGLHKKGCPPDETLAEPIEIKTSDSFPFKEEPDSEELPQANASEEAPTCEIEVDEPSLRHRKYKPVSFSMDMFLFNSQSRDDDLNQSETCGYRKFRSKIAPNENQTAEEELKKELNHDSFSKMDIIGQFNLGFIIARFGDDLFIIDQHATDEKYNFEQLQKSTILETQKLLQPQDMSLTAISENILLDNLHIFEMNGFHFKVEEGKQSGEKVQLVSVPVSQNWRFGKEDIDELIFMLTDNLISIVRPSRVNKMFASRACRKSVMIGTALTKSMMKKLVVHMGETKQPWNCPHGRPTIRHLFHLNLLKSF